MKKHTNKIVKISILVALIMIIGTVSASNDGSNESGVPIWVQAGFWGMFAGAASLVGALIGYKVRLSKKVIAAIMAFGSGVLISALSFELMEEAYQQAGFLPTAVGFFAGALTYSGINGLLGRMGAKHRKRSSGQTSEGDKKGSGTAIAVGALLDGIPESMAIGLTMLGGGVVSMATVLAIFISNIPEGLSSAAGMKDAGRSKTYIFGIWIGIAVLAGLSALIGYTAYINLSVEARAATTAIAAGAILSMLAETMIPEAFEGTHDWAGLITGAGFVCAFALSMLG